MRYRPEIDGLRAIAVLPVIFFHAGYPAFRGGFVGVDIFFVISGYLITRLIYSEIAEERFSIVGFYERRIRRIYPALFFVCAVCVPVAWVLLLPTEFKAYSQSLLGVSTFFANIYFWQTTGYFGQSVETIPLLHTWSLAVEEQFYLCLPLLLISMRRLPVERVMAVLLVLSAMSLALAQYASAFHPSANFYLLPTRAWELGVGAVLALRYRDSERWSVLTRDIVSAAGFVAIAWAVVSFKKTWQHPGIVTLVPVLGTAAIIASAGSATIVGKILASKPLVAIGLISYSAYLWHVPIFAFARIYWFDQTAVNYTLLGGLSILLAAISWKLVERPFRDKRWIGQRRIFCLAATVTSAFLAFGVAGHFSEGFPSRVAPSIRYLDAWVEDRAPEECRLPDIARASNFKWCVYGQETSKITVAVFGDSHAQVMAIPLGRELEQFGGKVVDYSKESCPPVKGMYLSSAVSNRCEEFVHSVEQQLFSDNSQPIVVLGARWTLYLVGERFENAEGGIEAGDPVFAIPVGLDREFVDSPQRIPAVGELYRASVKRLLERGARVVLVYPIPEVGWNVPKFLARSLMFGTSIDGSLTTSYSRFKERNFLVYKELDQLPNNENLIRVFPERLFCGSFVPDRCVVSLNNAPLYWDDDHLNASNGGQILSRAIVDMMAEKGWIPPDID